MSQQDHTVAGPLIARANDVIDRLFALDETVTNARAFRSLLEDLHARDLSVVRGPHVTAITMVRAGILRATIGTVMACLDSRDSRGNRASVGQILNLLRDADLVAVFLKPGQPADLGVAALQRANSDYSALVVGDLFLRGRRIRNDMIAHTLMTVDPTPTVTYETIYALHDAAERLVADLYQVCYRGSPPFLDHQASLTEHAKVFWDTYFDGMSP
jgi:hypothetical protein